MSGGASSGWFSAPLSRVEADRLRETLERLRVVLDAPTATATPLASNAVGHDRRAVAESLRHLLARLERIDLEAASMRSGLVREFRSDAQASHLRALFADLQRGLTRRVRSILGPSKIDAIVRLLSSPTPDVLRILGREDHENSHSDLIAWLLNPRRAPVVALHALRSLCAHLDNREEWTAKIADAVADDAVSVRREFVIARELTGEDDLCRIDIVVSGPGFVLAIENKVWSTEHVDQTTTYWDWVKNCHGLRGGLFLSPSGLAPLCSEFRPVSYLELVAALVDGPSRAAITAPEEVVLATYLKTLARGIIPVEMRAILEVATIEGGQQ